MGMSTSSDLLHHEHRALLYLKWLQGPERAGTVCCSNSSFIFVFFFFLRKNFPWPPGTHINERNHLRDMEGADSVFPPP